MTKRIHSGILWLTSATNADELTGGVMRQRVQKIRLQFQVVYYRYMPHVNLVLYRFFA